ncbi:hypothetical protein BJX63DRAFT_428303 [Aspergillus granulosus]|uniref:Uncharacterized protein n=1 Tax=Aspergillus granulosus TaxID=176169 RepID=A0ABR4HWV2_9EURO
MDQALWAHAWATFEDGRRFHARVPETARMGSSGDSSIAIWHGGGWMGSEEGYEVEIEVNCADTRSGEDYILARTVPVNFSTALGLGDRVWARSV